MALAGIFLACEQPAGEEELSPVTLTDSSVVTNSLGERYEAEYIQASSDNQNALVIKRDASNNILWEKTYDTSPVDTRAIMLALDEQERPYVVFTADGGSNEAGYITQKETAPGAFDNAIFHGYGRGGGAKVSILARLNPESGRIEKATFLLARTSEGNIDASDKTNTLVVRQMAAANGEIIVNAQSWYRPPARGSTHSNFRFLELDGDSPWLVRYSLDAGLSNILEAREVQ